MGSNPLLNSNETKKPSSRPSLLSAEQQNSLGQPIGTPAAVAPAKPGAAAAPRRTRIWLIPAVLAMVLAAGLAIMQSSEADPPSVTLVAVAPVSTPGPSAVATPPAPPVEAPPQQPEPVAVPVAAAIIDETPPPLEAKPKESLAQMLESGATPVAKAAPAKPVRKPVASKAVASKPAKPAEKPQALAAASQPDNDVELLAALVAHAKYDTSANARLSLPKALEQCKKQGKQDAARCRIRVCEGRWKKSECRAYSRSKLEKVASGS